jgi:hypothetical protein
MIEKSSILTLETIPQQSKKQVKELLQEWLDNDNVWDHLYIGSTFWWIGFLKFVGNMFADHQREE